MTSPPPPPSPPPAHLPAATVPANTTGRRGAPAGIVSRAAAYIIDAVVVAWLVSATSFVLGALRSLISSGPADTGPIDSGLSSAAGLGLAATAAGVAVVATTYFTLSWWLFGRSVGKLALGLRVVNHTGGRPSFTRSVVRSLMYYVSAIFMLGFIWIGLSPTRRGWHDRVARTWVVYDWDAHPHSFYDDDPLPPRQMGAAPTA